MSEFFTIMKAEEGLYKEKGSKFLAFAFPVQTIEEVNEHLSSLRKTYHDARHHCYAYMLGMREQSFRANDDGEPNHSAGDPILGQIRSYELTNVLVVVVRYFGGTKLGVGGLIHAYKAATDDALQKVKKKLIFPTVEFSLRFSYQNTSDVERVLSEFDLRYKDKIFAEDCEFIADISDDQFEVLEEKLSLLHVHFKKLS